jgi:hypothetical protein
MLKFFEENGDWKEAFSVASKPEPVISSQNVSLEDITIENVRQVIAHLTEGGDYAEKTCIGIFKLSDGRFISVCSECDTTGWDCQAGGSITVASTLEELIRYGLDKKERHKLLSSMDNLSLIELASSVEELSNMSTEELRKLLNRVEEDN